MSITLQLCSWIAADRTHQLQFITPGLALQVLLPFKIFFCLINCLWTNIDSKADFPGTKPIHFLRKFYGFFSTTNVEMLSPPHYSPQNEGNRKKPLDYLKVKGRLVLNLSKSWAEKLSIKVHKCALTNITYTHINI